MLMICRNASVPWLYSHAANPKIWSGFLQAKAPGSQMWKCRCFSRSYRRNPKTSAGVTMCSQMFSLFVDRMIHREGKQPLYCSCGPNTTKRAIVHSNLQIPQWHIHLRIVSVPLGWRLFSHVSLLRAFGGDTQRKRSPDHVMNKWHLCY